VHIVNGDSDAYVTESVACYTDTYRPLKAELIIHYADGFLINLYTSLMSHSFYMTKPLTFLPSFSWF